MRKTFIHYNVQSPGCALLIGIFVMLIGAFLTTFDVLRKIHASRSQEWPSVKGTLFMDKLESLRKGGTQRKVLYTYAVDGRLWTNTHLSLGLSDPPA